MHPVLVVLIYFGLILFGYFYGSFNNAIILSRLVFRKDIREFGSGNAGGTNMGRTFGKKMGMAVIILDVLKPIVVYWAITLLFFFTNLGNYIDQSATLLFAMVATALGHCFPIYYKFKGGKAVSILGGYLIAVSWPITIVALIIYFLFLKFNKIVSLTSIFMSFIVPTLSLLLLIPEVFDFATYAIAGQSAISIVLSMYAVGILVILKHRKNIEKMQQGTETKITWMK